MPALGEAADQLPRLAVNVALKVGQCLFAALALGLPLEQKDGQRPKQGEIARRGGFMHWAAVLVLGAVPAIVLPIFDAPVAEQVSGLTLALALASGHYLCTNVVYTLPNDGVTGSFDKNFLNIIVAQSATTNTLLDSSILAASNFVVIGTSGYCGAQVPVTNGVHTVTSSQPVWVEAYGWGSWDAYGYFGGIVK